MATTWQTLLRQQAAGIVACDFFLHDRDAKTTRALDEVFRSEVARWW